MLFLKYMIGVYISAAVIVLVLAGTIYGMYENKYLVDLLDDTDAGLLKLRRLDIEKLELKRYAVTHYLGSGFSVSRKNRRQIALESYDHNKTSLLSSIEDELEVSGFKGKMSHTIYKCPYSEENKGKLLEFVESYNN